MPNNQPAAQQRIVCAAVKWGDVIYCSARHYDDVMQGQMQDISPDEEVYMINSGLVHEGFIDQMGTFHNRIDALQIAIECGQSINWERNVSKTELYSEGLY